MPSPVAFEPEDLVVGENFEGCRGMVGFEMETWLSNEHYTVIMTFAELLMLRALVEIPEEEVRTKTEANGFLNHVDQKDYM